MQNKEDRYKDIVVNKPWGYEYLVYENEYVGLWFLHIEKDQETSLHCHPKKDTGLIVLEGAVDVRFLSSTNWLGTGKKIMIRKGLFHSTKALTENGANIFEIETPKLKHDLVRLEDKYGRKATPYEGKSHEQEKFKDCINFKDPKTNKKDTYIFSNCKIIVESITNKESLLSKEDNDNIIFLRGGILSNDNKTTLASPGDIIISHIVKRLLKTFKKIDENTIIMIIKPIKELI